MSLRFLQIFAVAGSTVPAVMPAQQAAAPGAHVGAAVAVAVRAEPGAPAVDGRLEDDAWAGAPVFSGFVQRDPDEGEPATERTEFRVVYTDDALFFGVRAYDSRPDEITALLTRRDEDSPSDVLGVMIDSYRDRLTAFQFVVNPAGVKQDAFLFDDTQEDNRWDAVWEVATSIDGDGWTAEFMIPFSQIRFSKADVNTFGFNVYRRVNRLNEEQYWRPLPKGARGRVSLFGDLTGIENITPPRRLEVLPYTVVQGTRENAVPGNPFQNGGTEAATVGADVKYGLNSWLTLAATINPDFGQVEADPAVVNLTAFETFFPERRPFFTEGLDIFRFRIADGDGDGSEEELFYTRRIGRAPQGRADSRGGFAQPVDQTRILTAAKLSGKTRDGWTVGVTGALTGQASANVVDSVGRPFVDVVEPRSVYMVGRLARDLRGGQTQVSLFGTTVQRDQESGLDFLHDRAYTGGMNWSHRFRNDTYQFSGRIVGSHVEGSPTALARTQQSPARYFQRPDADHVEFDASRTSLTGFSAAASFGELSGSFRWMTGFDTRSPSFEVNDLGFQRSADFTSQWVWLNRRWLEPGKVFRSVNLNFNQWTSWSYGWERLGVGGNLNANYTLWNYWNGWLGANRQFGSTSTGQLRGGPAISRPGALNGWGGFQSDSRKRFRGGGGGWFFVQDETDNWGAGINANLSWRPVSNADLTASPGLNWTRDEWQYLETANVGGVNEFIFGDLRQTTVSMTFRGNVTLSPDFSLQAYAQPFVSSGRYETYRRVVRPGAASFWSQFEDVSDGQVTDVGSGIDIDLDADGAADLRLRDPDFTVLSFRSNLVLRWEYSLGSTVFLVWQHGRSGFRQDGQFDLWGHTTDLFQTDDRNTLLLKVNYWISP